MAGYRPKFGLIGVDRVTRPARSTALALGQIAGANSLDMRAAEELKADAANPDGF